MKLTSIISIALISTATASSSYKYSEQVNSVLNQIDIAKAQVYDQAGNIRDDLIDTWSDSQLKGWLDAHSLQDSFDSINANTKEYSAKLKEQVLIHKDILLEDVKYYQEEAKAKAEPYIGKSKEFFEDSKKKQEKPADFVSQVQDILSVQYENAKRAVNELYNKLAAYGNSKGDL